MTLQRAERKQAPLKIGFSGPSGSGKSYSALLMASGMTDWNKIAVIDTENRSADLYSHLGGKDTYFTLPLTAPFNPEKYIQAIRECEKAGMRVIIIDSITHEWAGDGGCLQIQAELGGRYQDWAKVSPRHQAFIDAILQSPCHIFTTVRRKQDYDMTKNANGKLEVTKVGMAEVTRDGFEYELTLSFELFTNNHTKASKDRTGLFMGKPEFKITQETGKQLLAWSQSGAEPAPIQQSSRAEGAVPRQTPNVTAPADANQGTAPSEVQKTIETPEALTAQHKEQLRAMLKNYSTKNGQTRAVKVMKDVTGKGKLDEIEPEKYDALARALAV